jgi:hypothetical protein
MSIRFANSYVDNLFTERDMLELHRFISIVGDVHPLPEQFWLFCRVLEWTGATRSGIYQYYESLSDEMFSRMSATLERFELLEIAQKYRSGKDLWDKPGHASSLDEWIDTNEQQIENAIFELILASKADLIH